jgi:hypothetical protein
MEHIFTNNIRVILKKNFDKDAETVFEKSLLIQYLNAASIRVTTGITHTSDIPPQPALILTSLRAGRLKITAPVRSRPW